ncbi:hypothetical protein MJO28_005146 [Puccinia striiformis f. sp. tritici]|uniref:Uncharacterized protein n=4 Tax=Puccinia striiformis TaxID=27350 RepID=A0A0L0UVY2_9BASI|nr:hypothetical protein Pst134EA_009311 [Puccinia striiformis f. sp. tritici]KNE91207.1 hypothetical protein PSTG_15371 [Puccinia striiformis f. sp. tritici PST-78]POW15747.1 hypothetical protein PSTT_01919 [Puccinia striiformis]KAH9468779.1 hypothetical protein Pst134EA_009311 [Puccinia striiformis f. sp. tritici]KAI7954746.1 hypothetical protein MJO28_005146 [Puccinia striiformis f. sp. tritici]KAI7960135.1 hypothetical protein MJO29_005203 [Puccinia striiformis f. sp. tritici]
MARPSSMARHTRLSSHDSIKRSALRRKREAEKALIRARESLKIILKAKYPSRRPVQVGDTNSDTALASRDYIYEAPTNRRRGGGHGAPFLRSPLAYCPVATVDEPMLPPTAAAWVLFESPSFGTVQNFDQTSPLDCPIDTLNLATAPMTDSDLTDGLTKWWSELERCWELTLKSQEPVVTPVEPSPFPDFEITPEEFPLLFELLQS